MTAVTGLESRSYATACRILRDLGLRRRVLGPGELEFNEMELCPTLDRNPITPEMISRCRERCETELHNTQKRPLKLALADLELALLQVAHEKPFHPVRDYLSKLEWDRRERLSLLPGVLGAKATPLNTAMLRKFTISAVARALKPGCKADTALVLFGPQGIMKSAFFRALASPWFSDTSMTIGDKDSLLALRTTWIYEWAELDSAQRAARSATVKAFMSSAEDVFRAPYDRTTRRYPRSCVIVGTTNDEEFLTDPTGNRRSWVVAVNGPIDVDAVAAGRDQLWAEAVHAYRQRELWWLSSDLESALRRAQRRHEVEDPWQAQILGYAAAQDSGVTTAGVLEVLRVPPAQQTRATAMRVAAVLTRAGYVRRRATLTAGGRAWVYLREQGGQVIELEVGHA